MNHRCRIFSDKLAKRVFTGNQSGHLAVTDFMKSMMDMDRGNLIGHCILFVLLLNASFLHADDKIRVFVSVPPQKYFVERIGGDHVDVSVMVQPGHNPAIYEPTPKQMAALASTDLFFFIGVPFESVWAEVFMQRHPQMQLLRCCDAAVKINDHHHHESGNNIDPHIWTSPRQAAHLADAIYAHLLHLKPLLQGKFADNHKHLTDALILMDEKIKSKLADKKRKAFIVSHPAWGYFAHDYDLVQVSLEEYGRELNAAKLVDLIQFAKTNAVRTIFVQPQFNQNAASVLAKEINGNIITIDPLAEDYLANLDRVSDAIALSLR